MKKSLRIIIGLICLTIFGCSSEDEPEAPYTGPWVVGYYEEYSYTHNNSSEFVDWFKDHLECFVGCKFIKGNAQYEFYDYIELDDYDNYPIGYIEWIEIIDKATEDEVKNKVNQFRSFTIKDSQSQIHYDIFEASYKRYEGK